MKEILNKIKYIAIYIGNYKYIFPILLFIISFITHIEWFKPNSVITANDFTYYYTEAAKKLDDNYRSWVNYEGLGKPNIQYYFYFSKFLLISFFTNLGLSYNLTIKLVLLLPVVLLSYFSPYFLAKQVFKKPYIAFIVALIFANNTHIIVRQNRHLAISFIFVLYPLLIYLLNRIKEKNNFKNWTLLNIFFAFGILIEFRIMYIVTILLFLQFIFNKTYKNKNVFKVIIFSVLFQLSIHISWILPTIFTDVSNITSLSNRNTLEANTQNILYGLTVQEHSWTGEVPKNFSPQTVELIKWVFPFFILISIYLTKNINTKDKNIFYKDKHFYFYFLLYFLGVFILKQNEYPFINTYDFLREYLPGFILFRSASKFYFIPAIGLAMTLGALLYKLKSSKLITGIVIFITLLIIKPNLEAQITKKIGGTFINTNIDKEYNNFNKIIKEEIEIIRTLSIPKKSRFIYRDDISSTLDIFDILENFKNTEIISEDWSNLNKTEKIVAILKNEQFKVILDRLNVKYILINDKEYEQETIYRNINITKKEYINILEEKDYLKKVKDFEKNIVFENKELERKRIYIEENNKKEIEYKYIRNKPFEKIIKIKDPYNSINHIILAETYNTKWELEIDNNKNNKSKIEQEKTDLGLNKWNICCLQNIKEIKLTYTPNNYLDLGLKISLFSLFGLLFIYIATLKKK